MGCCVLVHLACCCLTHCCTGKPATTLLDETEDDIVLSEQETSELITEKYSSSHQKYTRQHNDRKVTSLGSLLGMPVELSNRITNKHNNQTYIH